jgi:hypothetical protein
MLRVGQADIADRVIRCRSTQETWVQNACRSCAKQRVRRILLDTSHDAVSRKNQGSKMRVKDVAGNGHGRCSMHFDDVAGSIWQAQP